MGRLLLCAAGTLAVLCCTSGAVQPPAQTTTEPFDADAFTSSFADVVDEFKAKAVSAVADQLSVYMDKIGVTKVVHEVMDTKLAQYLNTTGHALDDMITFFTEDDAEARLEGVVSKLADKIGFSLDALNGDATPSSTTTATDSSSPASIGDVVVATVGFDVSHAANIAAVQGKTLSVSGAAGFHFQAGLNIAKLDDFVFAVGGGASVGFSGADVNTGNASSTTATVQEVLARVADTTAVGGGKFWSKLDTLVTSTVSVDFVANPSDLTGFAYKVSITLPAFSAIKELHVYLRHPHWGCLPSHPEAMYNPTVMGWGVTLYSGKPSGMVADVKNLWTNLKASWGEMAALKGTWNSQWGTGSLSIGDTITVGTVGPSISFSQSACTAAGTPTTAPSSSTSEAVATVTSVAENLVKVINVVTPMILNAEFSAYFCMGECSTSHIDITQTISGTATFKVTSAHDGVEVDLVVPGLTVGGLTHVATEGLPGSVKSAFRGLATPIAGLGVAQSSVMIKVTTSGITISVVGEPSFPSTGQSDFQKVMETLSNVKLGVKTSFSYTGDIVMELDVATPPDTGNKVFAIVNVAGTMGFTLFTKVVVEPEPDLELGVSLPVKLCVEKCGGSFSNSRFLYLDGSVSLALSGSAQLVEGQLTMDGWWAKALGIPFVHVGNVLLGIGMDLKVGLPTKLEIGGAVCLGSETDCLGHTGTRIEGHVYVGVSATEPDSNYFTAMINQLTIGQVLSLVAEYAPGVSSVSIPSKVGQSGIYPYGGSAANAACDAQRSAGGSPTDLDMDCFAYASFNAGTDDKVLAFRSGNIVVPAGLAFAGRLNFYGWEFAVKAAVSPTAFLINATMDKVSIKKGSTTIMEIGEYLDTSHNVQGGGRFLVSVTADPATALVGIYGAFTIPVLQSYGELQVTLNADVFEFESDLHLFNGALSSHAHVKWDWDLSYFTATLSDMNFGGIVKADHIGFTYDESKSYAEFSAKVTVLALIGVDTTIKVQNNVITFFASASLSSLLTMEVTGRAVLANPFLSSSFDLTVHLKPGDLAKKIGAAVRNAALAVASTVQQALSDVETNLKNTFNDIKNEFNGALNALKNEAGKILDDINAFANDVVSVLDSVPGLSDAIHIGEALASGDMSSFGKLTLGSLGLSSTSHRIIDTGRRNKYGCPLLRQVWSQCYGCCFWEHCESKQSSDFPDVGCMKVA
eukprot:TRINITY_DN35600_c0_g1_i1.p1 TRINITY_DN35600_c0_g1~~TRINITY_DN35600_c0_g1_i1.p1  ORF type:complete len:1199 (+),score=522.61 TRINITY_DN35600_c0_g1_i1:125-3721(+)